ncbi:LIC_13387 family protein [Flavobacterium aestivum]|uniref:LIC_13387 family protein n=1 Tax=Flavobacterium aestivum TaxID=3003257 RepID=UPI0024830698|nr:hypothetical protein [Flavobacterium aestivum]
MTAKILWEIGSTIPLFIGIAHFRGALYSSLLHPTNKQLLEEMKVSTIEVDPKAILWKAWIGFNVTFSICLIFLGFINFYLAYYHFDLIQGFSIIAIATILSTALLSLISRKYLIKKVERIFIYTTIVFIISSFLSL